MAKFNYKSAFAMDTALNEYFPGNLVNEKSSKTEATWVDHDSFASFTIQGRGLKFEEGVLVGGKIEKIVFEDVEGVDYLVIKGEHDAAALGDAIAKSMIDMQMTLNAGNDKMVGTDHRDWLDGGDGKDILIGGDGNDTVWGNAGKDIMTGGAGSDTFFFQGKMALDGADGHDIITDFDAKGGGENQDYLAIHGEITDIYKDGKNTVIEVDDDLTLTLLNVSCSSISEADFLPT